MPLPLPLMMPFSVAQHRASVAQALTRYVPAKRSSLLIAAGLSRVFLVVIFVPVLLPDAVWLLSAFMRA